MVVPHLKQMRPQDRPLWLKAMRPFGWIGLKEA